MAPEDMDIGTYLEYARNKANKVPIAMRKSYNESVANAFPELGTLHACGMSAYFYIFFIGLMSWKNCNNITTGNEKSRSKLILGLKDALLSDRQLPGIR
jgi:hypothetical protein